MIKNLKIKLAFKKGRGFSMEDSEKSAVKKNLAVFMKKNPVINYETARLGLQRSPNLFERLQLISKPMIAVLVIALVVSLGGGASFAAQDSLPNEPLYPVKVYLNEFVESALALSDEAEADVQIKKVERRLSEATELAASTGLDIEIESEVEGRVQNHIDVLTQLQAKFEANGKFVKSAEVSARLEAILQAHESIFAGLNGKAKGIAKITAKVKEHADATAEASAEEDADTDTDTEDETDISVRARSAQALMDVAVKRIEITERFAQKHTLTISGEAQTELETAKTLVADGQAQFEAEAYAEAFITFKQALRHAQYANSLLAIGMNLKLDVDEDDEEGDEEDGNEEENEEEDENDEENELEISASKEGSGADASANAHAWFKFGL